jgi:A/G-specific adenine glycosylase
MLQQTQVSTVIPYWTRWMEKWPRVASLAAASEEEVLLMWEGLGYTTNRARNLLKAARKVMELHGGVFPTRHEELLELPGIGLYTAGAICSIAYNTRTRSSTAMSSGFSAGSSLSPLPSGPRSSKPQDLIWQISESLVRAAAQIEHPQSCSAFQPGDDGYGGHDLHSTNPLCLSCPLSPHCKAYKEQSQSQYPQPLARPALILREDTVSWSGTPRITFYFRNAPPPGAITVFAAAAHGKQAASESSGGIPPSRSEFISQEPLARLQHHITCYRITLKVYRAKPLPVSPRMKTCALLRKRTGSHPGHQLPTASS